MHRISQLKNKGYACHQRKEYYEALTYYQQIIEIDPNQSDMWFEMGSCFYDLKDYSRSLQCSLRAADLAPDLELAWYNAAISCLRQEKEPEALMYLTKALELNPQYFYAYRCRAGVHEILEDYPEAVGDWNSAMECPNVDLDDKIDCLFHRGEVYEKLKADDFAMESYTNVLKLNPQHKGALGQRALIQYNRGDLELALKDLNILLDLEESRYFRMLRGAVYLAMKKTQQAVKDLLG